MAKRLTITKEARAVIKDQIRDLGEITVEDVIGLISPHYLYDPIALKEKDIADIARRLLVSIRSEDGTRTVLAVSGQPGRFVNIDSCTNAHLMRKIDEQIEQKWEGLTKIRSKVKTKRAEIEGQQSLLAPLSQVQESGDRL